MLATHGLDVDFCFLDHLNLSKKNSVTIVLILWFLYPVNGHSNCCCSIPVRFQSGFLGNCGLVVYSAYLPSLSSTWRRGSLARFLVRQLEGLARVVIWLLRYWAGVRHGFCGGVFWELHQRMFWTNPGILKSKLHHVESDDSLGAAEVGSSPELTLWQMPGEQCLALRGSLILYSC